jgi:hypothetical protein
MHKSHDTVGGDDVRPGTYQRRIGLELLENVGLGVTRIQDDFGTLRPDAVATPRTTSSCGLGMNTT